MESADLKNGLMPEVQRDSVLPEEEISFQSHFVDPESAINITRVILSCFQRFK